MTNNDQVVNETQGRKNPYHEYDCTCIFAEFRRDHYIIKARSDKEAKRKVKNRYIKSARKDVKSIKVRRMYGVA